MEVMCQSGTRNKSSGLLPGLSIKQSCAAPIVLLIHGWMGVRYTTGEQGNQIESVSYLGKMSC